MAHGEEEYNKQTSKKKMWEKRLNENYFKLFRRRNREKREGERLRLTEECKSKMAATVICMTDSGELPATDGDDVTQNRRKALALSRERARAERIGTVRRDRPLVNPLSSVLGAFDYYLFIFPVNITIESCKKENT